MSRKETAESSEAPAAETQEAPAAATKEPAGPEWLTPRELAARLELAVGTVYHHLGKWWEEEGVVRLNERVVRIDYRKFEEALRAGRVKLGQGRAARRRAEEAGGRR